MIVTNTQNTCLNSTIKTLNRATFTELVLYMYFWPWTGICSRTFRHLFATLHVRWLSRIFNCNACVYQTATQWDLSPYRITICLIDWWCNVCLLTWWIDSRFLLAILTWETDGFELASSITLVLQANQLTKCATLKTCKRAKIFLKIVAK